MRAAAYPTPREIAPQRIGRAGTMREGHITVWPDQIQRVPGEAGLSIFRPPCERTKRHIVFFAPSLQFGTRGAIDMDLP